MFLNCKIMEIEDTSLDPSSHVQKVYNATFFGSQKCGWKSFHENELLSLHVIIMLRKVVALVGYVGTTESWSLGQWEKDPSLYCCEWCFRYNSKCYVARSWFGTLVTHQCATHHTPFPRDSVRGSFGAFQTKKRMVGIASMKSLASVFRVKILTRKMTIFQEGKWSRRRQNMFRDHNNIVEKDVSVWIEKENQFLLLTPDLSVRRRIHNKCSKSSYLDNQSSNDEARKCPKLAMT